MRRSLGLGPQNDMHIQDRRRNSGLGEHVVYLAAMMRLVIEKMQNKDAGWIRGRHAGIARVTNLAFEEVGQETIDES